MPLRKSEKLEANPPPEPVKEIYPLKRFPVYVDLHDRRDQTPLHRQKGIEINITHVGSGVMRLGKQRFSLSPRQALVFNAEQAHALNAEEGTDYMRSILCLDPEAGNGFKKTPLVQSVLDGAVHAVRLDSDAYLEADQLMCRIKMELLGRPSGWDVMAGGLAWPFMIRLLRMPYSTSNGTGAGASSALVNEVMDHVRTQLDGGLSLRETARRFRVSPEHLTRSFSRHTGLSFHRYVTSERILEAQRLLTRFKDTSLIDIALMTGFTSASSFSRAFRAAKGMSPSEYRKNDDFT